MNTINNQPSNIQQKNNKQIDNQQTTKIEAKTNKPPVTKKNNQPSNNQKKSNQQTDKQQRTITNKQSIKN